APMQLLRVSTAANDTTSQRHAALRPTGYIRHIARGNDRPGQERRHSQAQQSVPDDRVPEPEEPSEGGHGAEYISHTPRDETRPARPCPPLGCGWTGLRRSEEHTS